MKVRCEFCNRKSRVIRKMYQNGKHREYSKKILKLCNRCKMFNYFTWENGKLHVASVFRDPF